jgi:hypothetical protein
MEVHMSNATYGYLYIASFVIITLALLGDKSEDRPFAQITALIPFLNVVFAIPMAYELIKRIAISKGRCTFGHHMVRSYSSEEVKNRARRAGVPLLCSIAGIEDYKCTRCPGEQTITWKAF